MNPRRLALITVLFGAALLAAAPGAGAATGFLTQLQCLHEHTLIDTCPAAIGLGTTSVVAESPDGKTVYVAGVETQGAESAIAVFSRASSDGSLTQLTSTSNKDGCVTTGGVGPGGAGTCTSARGLDAVSDLAVSADGKTVYAATGGRLLIFNRFTAGTRQGALTQPAGTAGCVSQDGTDDGVTANTCAQARGGALASFDWLTVDSTNVGGTLTSTNVYAGGSSINSIISVFNRTPSGTGVGQVSQPPATDSSDNTDKPGCLSGDGSDGASGACEQDYSQVSVSTNAMALSPDGKFAYITSSYAAGVDIFNRDSTTGALTQRASGDQCVIDTRFSAGYSCTPVRAMSPGSGAAPDTMGIAISPDAAGKNVYVAAQEAGGTSKGGVASFSRNASNGSLTQLITDSGKDGCLTQSGNDGETSPAPCDTGRGLIGDRQPAISLDGLSLYVASPTDNAVAVIDRDVSTGALSQGATTDFCHSDDGKSNGVVGKCTDDHQLAGLRSVVVSPDLKNVYSADMNSETVSVFTRTPPPTHTVTGSVSAAGGGTVAAASAPPSTCASASCTVYDGGDATLTATGVSGFRFTGWGGDCSTQTSSVCSLTNITADKSATANFVQRFTVTAAASAGGTASASSTSPAASCTPSGSSCAVDKGGAVSVTASRSSGYRFKGWTSGPCAGTVVNPCQVSNVTADTIVTADFVKRYTITGVADPASKGSVVVTSASPASSCNGTSCLVDAGADVALKAKPIPIQIHPLRLPYVLTSWSGGCSGTTNPCHITAAADQTVTAHFGKLVLTLAPGKGLLSGNLASLVLACRASCSGTVTLSDDSSSSSAKRKALVLARGKFRHKGKGKFRAKERLTGKGRRRLRHKNKIRVLATIEVRPAHGKRVKLSRHILLKRKRRNR